MEKTSCYFYNNSKCRALTELLCRNKKCNFYKTKEQYAEDIKKHPIVDYSKKVRK